MAIKEFLEIIDKILSNSDPAQAIYSDFGKAFDTMNHEILL